MAEANFRAGGLISGLDTNSLIEQLTKLESIPLERVNTKRTAFTRQVSALGDIASKLEAFKSAATKLSTDGGLGVTTSSQNTGFTATPGVGAVAGQYDIEISQLATNARLNSGGNTKDAALKSGTLALLVSGTSYNITINEGDTLASVATAIKQSGAAVNATVLNNGTQDFLSIVRKDSGYTGADPTVGLKITPSQSGLSGEDLAFTQTDALNSQMKVNGLDFERTSNVVKDVVPGTTLTLKKSAGPVESLLLENDTTKTAANLKGFVDAYNSVMRTIQANLRPAALSDRDESLAGDGSLRSLQKSLQGVMTKTVGGQTTLKTLAELGFKTDQKDGSISIDSARLQKALDSDASAVNDLFSKATTGIGAVVGDLTSLYTNSVDGILTSRKKGINSQITGMGRQLESMSIRVDAFRTNLVNQFTAMEKTLSGLKFTGQFLSRQ